MKPKVLILVGPTASGKTSLAVELSKNSPIEIINADGLQVFRKLDIGTAKPSKQIRESVPHHLIDVLDPDAEINASWYAENARAAIEEISVRKKIPVIVGGAGFYIKALERPPTASASSNAHDVGNLKEAYERLQREDAETAQRLHPNDRYRISRAIQLLDQGKNPSGEWKRAAGQIPPYDSVWIGLAWEREALYDRINRRVEEMFEQGLVKETESVLDEFPKSERRLSRTIGYRESLGVLRGKMRKDEALPMVQMATRQYAKRQLTWFRREKRIQWLSKINAVEKANEILSRF